MVYILTSTKTILETEVRAQESRTGDNVVEGLLALKLKSHLLAESYDEQQKYVNAAAIASYISLNKLDQRNRYRASVGLQSITGNDYSFTKGSSSSGLGYSLALFESWWNVVLKKQSKFTHPVFATGEILTSGAISKISHLSEKLDAVCTYVENNKESFQQFYICFPMENDDEISDSTREAITKLGGILLSVSRLQELLHTILGNDYDGDPLGRWEPFKGLNSFDYEDSVRFFGRDKDVARLYDDLKQNNGLLIVAGVSGSGKSSLIKAGLIPRLEQEVNLSHWAYTTPTKAGSENGILRFILAQLSIAWGLDEHGIVIDDLISKFNVSIEEGIDHLQPYITDQAKRCLLYFDQYEEVFSQSNQDIGSITRDLKLIDALARQFESLDIVLALRNEYLGRLLDNQALSSPIISNIASQISPDDWHAIVHEQAQFSGINFETDGAGNTLDKDIIEQAVKTPYALPMVEFLLEQLYLKAITKSGGANTLLFEHYEQMGGLSGAIAYRAQSVLDKHKANKYLIDSFFEIFVGLNSESLPYARHVHIEKIKSQDLNLYQLVLGFIDANLIVFVSGSSDDGQVRFAHDSLFSTWESIKKWIDNYQDYLIWRNSIDGLYQRWQEEGKDKKHLLKDKGLINEGFFFIEKNILGNNLLKDYIKESRSKNNLTKINILVFLFLIPALIGSFFYWDYTRYKIYTYEEIAKKLEVPFGINEINSIQIGKRNYHYSLVYQGGRLKKVKKLNSVGNLFGKNLEDEVALWEYRYSDTGKVNEVISKTRSGKTAAVSYYQFSSEDSAVLRFSKDIDTVGFFAGSSKDPFELRLQQGKSKVSRKLLKFYENGLLKQISYQDPDGRNTAYKGYYGSIYEYNNEGLITKITKLNKNLEPIISSRTSFQYDSNNRKISESKGQIYDLSEQRFIRDSWGNIIDQSSFYKLDPTTHHGVHKLKFSYDQYGFLIEKKKLNINEELVVEQSSDIPKLKYKYDGNGNLAEVSCFGTNDQLIYNKLSGFALGKFKFNDKNQLKESSSFGVLKEPILRVTAKLSNVFNNKLEYDTRGNISRESYFGIQGEPILASNGIHRIDSKYNKYDQLIEQRIYGVDNKPTYGTLGLFMKKFGYDSQGNLAKASSYGIKEEPIINVQGFHAAANKYDGKGYVIEETTYDTQGNLMLSGDGMAVLRMKYDGFGNTTETSFYDRFNKPTLDKEGLSRVVTNYEGGRSIGRISGFEYYGISDEPVLNAKGVHRSVIRFDSNGRMNYSANYGVNNELVIKKGSEYSKSDALYYENSEFKLQRFYGVNGSYTQLSYDSNGNVISYSFHDKDQNAILGTGDNSGFSKKITQYDDYGNQVKFELFDENGGPGVNKHGYSKVVNLTDKNGVLTHIQVAYDINGNLIPSMFSKRVIKIKDKVEDRKVWEYVNLLNTKDAFQLYLNLVENGLYKEDAQSELLKFTSNLKIKSLTEGGKILLNGKYLGYQEINIHLKPGVYKVAIKNRGYRTYKKNIVVKDSDTEDLSIILEKDSSSWDKKTLILEANEGNAEAQKNLGNEYLNEENYTQAMSWYQKAADQGYSPAIHNVGYFYETAKGVKKDLQEAYKWYLKAANNGFAISQWRLGNAFYKGDLVEKDYERSLDYFTKAADQGDKASQYRLGLHYIFTRGQSTRPSIASIKAFNYFNLASLQGVKPAYRYLGVLYATSVVMDFDFDKVKYWYEKAFNDGGDAKAALLLAGLFSSGEGVEIDLNKSISWFVKAFEKAEENSDKQTMLEASTSLYKIYFEGTTFFKDRDKGIYWLKKSAELNNQHAINNLKIAQRGGKYRY